MALKERKIEIVEWVEKGKCVGGYLLGVTRQKVKDGSVGLTYQVRRTDDSIAIFKGATRLNFALSPSDVNKFIQVEYLGEDESKEAKDGMNRPKLFRVGVDEERTLTPTHPIDDASDPGINDSDIHNQSNQQ